MNVVMLGTGVELMPAGTDLGTAEYIGKPTTKPSKPKFDRKKIAEATEIQWRHFFDKWPKIPWHVDPTTHAAILEKEIVNRLEQHFAMEGKAGKCSGSPGPGVAAGNDVNFAAMPRVTLANLKRAMVLLCNAPDVAGASAGLMVAAWPYAAADERPTDHGRKSLTDFLDSIHGFSVVSTRCYNFRGVSQPVLTPEKMCSFAMTSFQGFTINNSGGNILLMVNFQGIHFF